MRPTTTTDKTICPFDLSLQTIHLLLYFIAYIVLFVPELINTYCLNIHSFLPHLARNKKTALLIFSAALTVSLSSSSGASNNSTDTFRLPHALFSSQIAPIPSTRSLLCWLYMGHSSRKCPTLSMAELQSQVEVSEVFHLF